MNRNRPNQTIYLIVFVRKYIIVFTIWITFYAGKWSENIEPIYSFCSSILMPYETLLVITPFLQPYFYWTYKGVWWIKLPWMVVLPVQCIQYNIHRLRFCLSVLDRYLYVFFNWVGQILYLLNILTLFFFGRWIVHFLVWTHSNHAW